MNTAEAIAGFIASVCAVVGTMIFSARWLAHRFDRWTESVIDNSRAIRGLTTRVDNLEKTIGGR